MLTKISLVIALCSHMSIPQIQSKLHELQSKNPDNEISLRFDKKATCDANGNVIKKSKKIARNQ